ncbi:IclR family transcriptional regulator [Sinirhodobacter sp. WL0062]|uniref:IclR family transcriptional regulator n=1 Tax=Rhodobacter flavimaris TaxID=2907145 RepID=A0ABS8YWF1_9RHOB|nr:IclR family transcriptional regulator [Sinirhodobacter sp. WL0062]MCE5973071.1 IclR family transcriptional regulator [Sinirhodobacter sp. WL0062]
MSFSHTERSLRAIEVLAEHPEGLQLAMIASLLEMPKPGAHRLMAELVRLEFVTQDQSGAYLLTPRLVSIAFRHLACLGTVDAAQPVLDRLAKISGELVRLSVTDTRRQVFVAKAQGARGGLIYDPQMGEAAHLASMATGLAWLSTMDDIAAMRLVTAQGLGGSNLGPNAPKSPAEVLARLENARSAGLARAIDSSAPGMSAIAAPVFHPGTGACLGTVSIGGPSSRLTPERIEELLPALRDSAAELSDRVAASTYFTPARAAN